MMDAPGGTCSRRRISSSRLPPALSLSRRPELRHNSGTRLRSCHWGRMSTRDTNLVEFFVSEGGEWRASGPLGRPVQSPRILPARGPICSSSQPCPWARGLGETTLPRSGASCRRSPSPRELGSPVPLHNWEIKKVINHLAARGSSLGPTLHGD